MEFFSNTLQTNYVVLKIRVFLQQRLGLTHVKEVVVKGQKGNLSAEFYNDDLCCLSFYPDDYGGFTKIALGRAYKKQEVFDSVVGNVNIRNADWNNREGVSWRDIARERDLRQWVLATYIESD